MAESSQPVDPIHVVQSGTPRDADIPPSGQAQPQAIHANPGSPEELTEGDALALQLEECRQEKESLYERLLRKQAEFENFRKRTERERGESAREAKAATLREFLPVIDACDRARKSLANLDPADTQVEAFRSGLELIYRQFMEVLGKFNVAPIESEGHPFDPHLHHAIMREETGAHPENHILEELLRGYTFEGRLLRPAQVKVAIPPQK